LTDPYNMAKLLILSNYCFLNLQF